MHRFFCFLLCFFICFQTSAALRPQGVNLGGWFVLEDWFFSSAHVDHFVATPCMDGENGGLAESNIFLQRNAKNFRWTSETQLIHTFLKKGYTEKQVTEFFNAHRASYLLREKDGIKSLDDNFAYLESLGIHLIRLPVTWAITYPDHAYQIDPGHGKPSVVIPATTKTILIQDPFYPDLKWASIPITAIEAVLKIAQRHGLKIVIDVHAFPGGSGGGTYNGVWPNPPRFWTTGRDKHNQYIYEKNFQVIVKQLIQWADHLYTSDQSYAHSLLGLSPLNEPAHLLGVISARCDQKADWEVTYQSMLNTLALAVKDFRNSSLPKHHVELIMNIIETAFPQDNSSDDTYKLIGNWWKSITTKTERQHWADLDIHHYVAWDPACNQCLTQYIDKKNQITKAGFAHIKHCSLWYQQLRDKLGLSKHDLLSTTEFSASTNNNTALSCASGAVLSPNKTPTNYKAYRNYFLMQQLKSAKKSHIAMYFWTWMIPYNKNYQSEWSLYDICRGDEAPGFCGA